jgi:hypothetical protein
MNAQSRPTLVVQEPLPNKTIWSFQGLKVPELILKKFSSSEVATSSFLVYQEIASEK